MILLDTNVIIYAADPSSRFSDWARGLIASTVSTNGAALNAISVAEICVGAEDPGIVTERLQAWGITLLDVPVIASEEAARAYRNYRLNSSKGTPVLPLADFFIGAHAQTMGWELATADKGRFKTYFPKLTLIEPER